MNDFLTRVAERALGTAPRIDPQSASRYSPSRLPLPESPLPDLPESPLPDMTAATDPDSAAMTPPRDSYVAPPTRRQSTARPIVTPVTGEAVASDSDYVAALKTDRSPEAPGIEAGSSNSPSRSITHRTSQAKSVAQRTPLDSQTRSIAERDREAAHLNRAPIPEPPSMGTSPVISASEASTIRDDARHRGAESSPFSNPEASLRSSDDSVSAPKETAPPYEADEPQTAALVARPYIKDRDVESKLSVASDSIRSSTTTPSTVVVPDDREPAVAFDYHHETRGPVSADFVRPATGRVDYSNYEREEQSEPSIRVTIGRVEVRTVPPAAVVEPVAPQTAKLSLADFLREHNERRR